MKYPFQFSTVMTLFVERMIGKFNKVDLFTGMFDGIIATIDEKDFPTPDKYPVQIRTSPGHRKTAAPANTALMFLHLSHFY